MNAPVLTSATPQRRPDRGRARGRAACPRAARIVAAMSGGVDSTVTAALLATRRLRRGGRDPAALRPRRGDPEEGRLLRRPGHPRRAHRRREPGHPALRARLREPLPRAGDRGVRRRLSARRDADPLRPLQSDGEVPRPAGRGPRPGRRGHGHRPLRPPRGRARTGRELHRAADADRDQSYFLFATTREQLAYLRFPLGGLPKPAVRAAAAELGLAVADKPDSQDICFVPEGRYTTVIDRLRPHGARARRHRAPGRPRAGPPRGRHPLHRRPAPRPERRGGRSAVRGAHRRRQRAR